VIGAIYARPHNQRNLSGKFALIDSQRRKPNAQDAEVVLMSSNVLKILILGKFGVGKTSLRERFVNDTFSDNASLNPDDFLYKTVFNGKAALRIADTQGLTHARTNKQRGA
jgi:GTPase SAR1 family protein